MKPRITCYMMSSLDGRIDCEMTEHIEGTKEYYDILESYNFDAFVSGKVTAYTHYAKKEKFVAESSKKINKEEVFIGLEGNKYNVVVDTNGTLTWENNLIENLPIIMLLSENVTLDYLNYLKKLNISYIVTGEKKINLISAMNQLNLAFGIKNVGVVGGGNINGSFLDNNLLDEIGVLIGPGIDGRGGMTALFDGLPSKRKPYQLALKDVKIYPNGCVFIKYQLKGE